MIGSDLFLPLGCSVCGPATPGPPHKSQAIHLAILKILSPEVPAEELRFSGAAGMAKGLLRPEPRCARAAAHVGFWFPQTESH